MPLLECKGLVRRFGALVAVDDVDMAVEPGEIRAVIGPNGAGKSTFFNLITSVLKPSAGQVIFAGENITGMPVHRVAQLGIARTFQLCHIFPALTVRENVRIAAQARDHSRWRFLGGGSVLSSSAAVADEAIERMRLTRFAEMTAAMLSHGDQRLLEVAMAIAQKPRLLMLDEPTQGLSIEETGRAVQILKDMLAEGDSERAPGRARHGGGVRARRQHHGPVSRPRDRRRTARRRARQCRGAQRLSRRVRVMLRVEGLHTYYGQGHILQGVDLEVPAGRIAAVLGRNGVGKTTTLRSIVGLTPPRRGHVLLAGRDVAGWAPHRIARVGVGYVPEGRMIFPDLTVVENIQVAQRIPARKWSMERLFSLFPALAERRRSKGSQLSGGEQQMLAVARALVTDPRVILLDEPSQGLAPLVVEELTRLIARLRDEGVSLLLVEQNLNLAEAVADVVYVMVKGRMVYHAPLERFRAEREEVKAKYLTL